MINNDYRRRLIGSGGRKNKACLDLEIFAGRQFTPTELTTDIIYRNCPDKNETIVNKVNLVTNSLKTGQEAIAAQKESGTSTKRLSSDASGSSTKTTSSEQEFMLLTRDPPHKQIYLIHQRRRVRLKLAY